MNLEIGDRHWQNWQNFRVAQVDQFVAKVSKTLHQKRPNLVLSAAVFAIVGDRRLEQIQRSSLGKPHYRHRKSA